MRQGIKPDPSTSLFKVRGPVHLNNFMLFYGNMVITFFFICSFVLPTVPPSIADEPTELTVTRLSPVVIACTASGVPEPSIHWSKDGMKLPQEGQGFNILPTGQLQNRTFLC